MRASRFLLSLATTACVFGAIAAGCGGSTNNSSSPGDSGSGSDVTMEAAMEAAPEAAKEAAPEAAPEAAAEAESDACTPDADITKLMVPDAAFGDAGATAATCLSCFETACPQIIAACNANCTCVSGFETFGQCLGQGKSLITCGSAFAGNSGGIVTNPLMQLACAIGCATPSICGVSIPTGGDSGMMGDGSSGDGSSGDGTAD